MSAFWGITLLILAVMSGAVLVLGLKQKNGSSLIKPLLSFSGGFLISIAFLHFIPAIYSKHTESIGVYILLGFLIQLFLEYFSGGIEHGHVHPTKNGNVPIVLFISLSVHSILEGIPLAAEFIPDALGVHVHDHHGHSHSHDSGHSLLFGIIFHNIPVAIALTTLLIQSGWQRWSTLLILFIFSLTAPLGILIGINAPHLFSGYTADIILAIVVGMFLHISTTIIFETSEGHRFNLMKLITLLAGAFLGLWFH
ncbi:ZIP family metal transporter [Wandonia haliotis]|uniref:ZIP family metal transporter n=1 Tax=Wandonia haliotis TaxID=574963 RepID=A0ABN1MQF2_9FLAO